MMEIASVSLFVVFYSVILYNVFQHLTMVNIWMVIGACILAMVLADVLSGLAHWGADTWGTLKTPVVGQTFIRSFREHHVDPFRITVHDLIETNGDNCLLCVPALGVLSFVKIKEDDSKELFVLSFIVFLALWIAFTNQIHKWAHMIKPPSFIAFFQDLKIILSRKNHQIHHHNPFDRYYCITNGWLNPILGAIGFWKRMEIWITHYTPYKPRVDDAFWTMQQANLTDQDDG